MATQSDCAIHLFISLPRLRDLVDSGVITRQAPSCYDIDVVRREVLTHLRAQASNRGAGENLSQERAALARSQRELSELKSAQLRGAVIEIERVAEALETRYANVKERVLSMPGLLATNLVGLDRAAIEKAIRNACIECLEELYTPARVIEEAGGRPDHDGEGDQPTQFRL
jgi:hypothetical protein